MMGLFGSGGDAELNARLVRLERKIDLILEHLGLGPPGGEFADVRQLVAQGKKIEAIKVYREQTGAGLREAKDFVDSL